MATPADLLGIKLPDNTAEDPISELSPWNGVDAPVRGCLVHHSLQGNFSIRQGKWKLECCPGSSRFNPPVNGRDTAFSRCLLIKFERQ